MKQAIQIQPNGEMIEKFLNTSNTASSTISAGGTPTKPGPRVSLYLPEVRNAVDMQKRRLLLIRQIKEAERLILQDYEADFARTLMQGLWATNPLEKVCEQYAGVAVFHSREATGLLFIPVEVNELVVVATSFHLKPVIQWLQTAVPYYLVTLSAKRIQLYRGDAWELRPVDSLEAPEEVKENQAEKPRKRDQRAEAQLFMQKAAAMVDRHIRKDRLPVILAGVGYLRAIFSAKSHDPDLVHHAISGNVDRWKTLELRRAAFDILKRLSDEAAGRTVEEFREKMHTTLFVDDLSAVAKAVAEGRVHKLLVASDVSLFGRYNMKTGKLVIHSKQLNSYDDDLLDDLSEIVLEQGGRVMCLPFDQLPTANPVSALLRQSAD